MVRNHQRLPFEYENLGERKLKGFEEPVRVYMVRHKGSAGKPESAQTGSLVSTTKPSIAVLPFANMSGEPEQEYFSDGITEDVITALSRFKSLLVTSRNSSFAFKGSSVDVREVGTKLRVRYVVEGSVRRAGNRVRVTGQLIDADSDTHLWAERYDRDLDDIFGVQDEIVRAIASAIPGHINRVAIEQLRHKAPSNLTAYDCELRGRWAFAHWNEGLETALDWFEKSVKADPDYALAHAALAMANVYGLFVLGSPPETVLERGLDHAKRAIALDDHDPTVNAYAAYAYCLGGVHALARKHAARAVELNPNDPFVLFAQACALSYTGEPEEALEWFAKSEQLEPYAPDDQRLDVLCDCYYMLGDYEKVEEIHKVYRDVPTFLYVIAAIAFAQAGEIEKADLARNNYERLRPAEHDVKTMCKFQVEMCSREKDREHWLAGYRKAGFEI